MAQVRRFGVPNRYHQHTSSVFVGARLDGLLAPPACKEWWWKTLCPGVDTHTHQYQADILKAKPRTTPLHTQNTPLLSTLPEVLSFVSWATKTWSISIATRRWQWSGIAQPATRPRQSAGRTSLHAPSPNHRRPPRLTVQHRSPRTVWEGDGNRFLDKRRK